jgi:hypothetical protein
MRFDVNYVRLLPIRVPAECRGLALVLGWRRDRWRLACFWYRASPQKGTMKFTGVACHFLVFVLGFLCRVFLDIVRRPDCSVIS